MTEIPTPEKREWLRHPSLRIGAIASLLFLLIGFVSIAWVPYPIENINVGAAMQDMSAAHWLGTDHLGRDMLSLVMKGTLTSFVVAAIAVAIGALIGVPLGLAAAAWGGPAEWGILRVNDFLFAFPALIIAILITTIFGPSAINAMIAVGVFNIPVFARVARGGALSLKTLDYVAAARLAGMGPIDIARRHILPNIASLIIVQATIQLALGILAEASLSYVGLGTQPPATSLGLMLKDAQTYALLKPSLALIPGITIILIVIALNLAGDGPSATSSTQNSDVWEAPVALLSVEELTIRFGGTPVVDTIGFSIGKGQRFGVIGESGSGKSLTALAIMGLLPEDAEVSGSLIFDTTPLPSDEEARAKLRGKRIAMVFQEPMTSLNPLEKAGAQVAEAMELAGQAQGDVKAEVERLFVEVGLESGHTDRYPHQLSGGQRQRVMIAMALAGKPDLLICDEPTSALDLITQRKVIDLIDRVCTDRGMALMFISHDLKAVAALCTKIMVIRRGKVVEIGDKLDVLGHPKHDYTKLLLAAGRHRARTLMRAPISGDMLVVRDLTKRYRQPDVSLFEPRPALVALDGVNFSIRAGESLALVGPSGSGKSTLARIIVGLDRATKGELEFDHQIYHGTDLPRMHRRDISLVFQDPFGSFNPRLTIGESVAEPLRLEQGAEFDELGRRIVEVVQAVGLSPEMLNRYPHEFSGGQRQRFAIARALITRPRLVVLDEPVSALDVSVRGEVLVLLNRLRADYGLTFLVISHDLDMVRIVADRVMVMDKGRIIETGTPAQLLDKPQEPLTKELIAASLPDVGIVPVL